MASATLCNSKNGGQGCKLPVLAMGFCSSHYFKLRRGRDPHGPIRQYGNKQTGITLRLQESTLEVTVKQAKVRKTSAYILRRVILESWLDQKAFRHMPLAAVSAHEDDGHAKKEITVRMSEERLKELADRAETIGMSTAALARSIIQTWVDLPAKARPLNEIPPDYSA